VTEPGQEAPDAQTTDAAVEQRGIAGFIAGVILGAVVGAGIAMLFAPARGDRLRRRLGKSARALRERARDELEDAARRARREIARRR
jgi:gas vesicle protein